MTISMQTLQDALVAVRDLAYDRDARIFVLVANRFRWEGGATAEGAGRPFERTLCGIAFDEIDSVVRCIEAGAEDYLSKPFDPVLLRARIGASLEKVRLRESEQAAIADITTALGG